MNQGFHIRKLRVTGNQKKPGVLEFGPGLNVIAGASDTGKSYIFQCIDYLMGARKVPKDMPHSHGYNTYELEIEDSNGQIYSLKRTSEGSKYLIKEGPFDSDAQEVEYADRLGDDQKNISSFLLSLCGFDNVILKKSKAEKVRLSFRDISGLTMIDEKQIITEDSPACPSSDSVSRPKEQSLFYYLITGKDASDLQLEEDTKTFKGKVNGKIEYVKELIAKTQGNLDAYKGQDADALAKQVNESLDALSLEYNDYIRRIDALKKDRNLYHAQKTKKESTILFKKELIARFELLKKHYLSDQARLQFISEGSFLVGQLNNVSCPLCGGEIKDDHINCLIQYEKDNVLLGEATQSEMGKISLKLAELDLTIGNLKKEVADASTLVEKLATRIASADENLERNLSPVTSTLKQRIDALFREKSRLEEYHRLRELITAYTHQVNDLHAQLKTKNKQSKSSLSISKAALDQFCKVVEDTLREWAFPGVNNVNFDTKYDVFDILINSQPRNSSGKGIRAITYSAFVVALMRFTQARQWPNSYNLVFDSPLTTYKEKDRSATAPAETDTIGKDVETAFFHSLQALSQHFQVIILDNKEPPADLLGKIHYIHFSGLPGVGRPGFFE